MIRSLAVGSASVLGLLVASFASCATNTGGGSVAEEDAASSFPEVGPPLPDLDGGVEAGCDASDPGCTTKLVACGDVSWCLESTPTSGLLTLTAVWGSSRDDVWAVGSAGTIIHYGGKAWTATPSGTSNTFFGIWGSGPNDVWITSTAGLLLHGTGFGDGAPAWANIDPTSRNTSTSFTPSESLPIRAIWGSSADDVRLGTTKSWRFDHSDASGFAYNGSSNQFVKTVSDGGVVWRVLPGVATIFGIWGSSADDVWILAENPPYERGTTLHGTPYLGPHPNPAVLAPPRSACSGCEPGCTACAAVEDRLGWTVVDSQSKLPLESVWGSSADDVWSVGEQGTIRRIQKGDVRWQTIDSPTKESLHAVWGSGPNDVWMVGDSGTILHYDGAKIEASTAQLPLGPKPNLRGIWGSGPSDVWIVGDVVLHFTGPKRGAPPGAQK